MLNTWLTVSIALRPSANGFCSCPRTLKYIGLHDSVATGDLDAAHSDRYALCGWPRARASSGDPGTRQVRWTSTRLGWPTSWARIRSARIAAPFQRQRTARHPERVERRSCDSTGLVRAVCTLEHGRVPKAALVPQRGSGGNDFPPNDLTYGLTLAVTPPACRTRRLQTERRMDAVGLRLNRRA
jgi:hypothetical protein